MPSRVNYAKGPVEVGTAYTAYPGQHGLSLYRRTSTGSCLEKIVTWRTLRALLRAHEKATKPAARRCPWCLQPKRRKK